MELIFATHNQHKVDELQQMLKGRVLIQSLTDIDFHEDIEESGKTFDENAYIKAKSISEKINRNVFADDSGLVIEALNGEPGIFSARYAGTGNSLDNIAKVLKKLENEEHRKAYFITVICLIFDGKTHFFEGKVWGNITKEIRGTDGFGYDPIFVPEGYDKTFAEMSADEKNNISHRYLATQQLIEFLS